MEFCRPESHRDSNPSAQRLPRKHSGLPWETVHTNSLTPNAFGVASHPPPPDSAANHANHAKIKTGFPFAYLASFAVRPPPTQRTLFYFIVVTTNSRTIPHADHLALASFYNCDMLVTWNCRHLANANKTDHIRRVNALLGLRTPLLVTPLELMEKDDESET